MFLVILTVDAVVATGDIGFARLAVFFAIVSLPWLVLAGVQAFVRHPWPTLVSAAPWLAVTLYMLIATEGRAVLQVGLWFVPLGFALAGWSSVRQAVKPLPAMVPDAAG